jgi:lipopolysaccharide heptosyltransferase I
MQPANLPAVELGERSRSIARLLVVRLSAMGDVLHALPAVAALRLVLPETSLGWVVEERWADLVRYAFVNGGTGRKPVVDQVHTVNFKSWRHSLRSRQTWRETMGTVKELRAADYQVAVDFQGAVRSSLVARLSGAPSIYGFAEPRENVASMFYTTSVVAHGKHVIQQNLSLASSVAGRPLHVPGLEFPRDSDNRSSARAADGYVILNPGAGWGAKQWPAERYGEVAQRLGSQLGLRCLINVGPGEDDLMRAAQRASAGAAEPISCSPLELIHLTGGARLFIGGDTGPMHLAAALAIPVVAIFGPTDPSRTGPFGTRSIVLRNPHSRTTLSHQNSPDRGMLEISTDDVMRAAIELLRGSGE